MYELCQMLETMNYANSIPSTSCVLPLRTRCPSTHSPVTNGQDDVVLSEEVDSPGPRLDTAVDLLRSAAAVS